MTRGEAETAKTPCANDDANAESHNLVRRGIDATDGGGVILASATYYECTRCSARFVPRGSLVVARVNA